MKDQPMFGKHSPEQSLLKESATRQKLNIVVIANQQPLGTIELWPILLELITVTKERVTKMVHDIAWLDDRVPTVNKEFIHLIYVIEYSRAIALVVDERQNIGVVIVKI
jgi:hypothetical protein